MFSKTNFGLGTLFMIAMTIASMLSGRPEPTTMSPEAQGLIAAYVKIGLMRNACDLARSDAAAVDRELGLIRADMVETDVRAAEALIATEEAMLATAEDRQMACDTGFNAVWDRIDARDAAAQ